MTKQLLLFVLLLFAHQAGHAQAAAINDTTRAAFYSDAEKVRINLDMGQESLEVPGMSFLGPVHAYMAGNIYGVWMLTKGECKNGTAILRFTNDIGSDAQTVELKPLPDGTYEYRAVGGNAVRRVKGRRLVKIPEVMIMRRLKL